MFPCINLARSQNGKNMLDGLFMELLGLHQLKTRFRLHSEFPDLNPPEYY